LKTDVNICLREPKCFEDGLQTNSKEALFSFYFLSSRSARDMNMASNPKSANNLAFVEE
jgi:hypothetical protein